MPNKLSLRALFIIKVFILMYFTTSNILAEWKKAAGLNGGEVEALYTDGASIFASSSYELFRASLQGEEWEAIGNGFNVLTTSFAKSSSGIFLGSSNGVYRSINQGKSFVKMKNGIPEATTLLVFTYGKYTFAGSWGGLYRSSDGGDTWESSPSAMSIIKAQAFAVSNTYLIVGTQNGIFRSVDSGSTWANINGTLATAFTNTLYDNGSYLFCGTWDYFGQGTLFRSQDNGATWTKSSFGISSNYIQSIVGIGTNLFAATKDSGVYFSNDQGGNWAPVNKGLYGAVKRLIVVSESKIFAGTSSGVFRYDSNSLSWSAVGLPRLRVNTVSNFKGTLLSGTQGGSYSSNDTGKTWNRITGAPNGVLSYYEFADKLFAANNSVWKLSAIDSPWINISENNGFRIFSSFKDTLLLGSYFSGICISADSGKTYTEFPKRLSDKSLTALQSVNGLLIAGTERGFFVSTDRGITWSQPFSSDLYDVDFFNLNVIHNRIYAGTTIGLYSTIDSGKSWVNHIGNGKFATNPINVFETDTIDNYILAATSRGLLINKDNGNEWISVSDTNGVQMVHKFGNIVIIGSGDNGLLYRPLEEMILPPPNTISPKDDSIVNVLDSTSATWEKLRGASKYQIQISIDSLFKSVSINDSTILSSYRFPKNLLAPSTYFWRVRGCANYAFGNWSVSHKFKAISQPVQIPILTVGTNLKYRIPIYNSFTNKICFSVPKKEKVVVKLFNISGNVVAHIINQTMDKGNYEISLSNKINIRGLKILQIKSETISKGILYADATP